MTSFAKNLTALRKQQKITQDDLARQLNVTRQTVSSWERGRSEPDIQMLMQLAQVLQTSVNSLVSEQTEAPSLRSSPQLGPALIWGSLALLILIFQFTLRSWLVRLQRQWVIFLVYPYDALIPPLGFFACGMALLFLFCAFFPVSPSDKQKKLYRFAGILTALPALCIGVEAFLLHFLPGIPQIFSHLAFYAAVYPFLGFLLQKLLPLLAGAFLCLSTKKDPKSL